MATGADGYNGGYMTRLLVSVIFAAMLGWAQNGGFSVDAIDRTVNPCQDFYRYACGGWMAKNPIPADKSSYGRFEELYERNLLILRGLLEESAQAEKAGPVDQRIGGMYASCMDEAGIEKAGLGPVKKDLEELLGLKDMRGVMIAAVELHKRGMPVLFSFEAQQDFKDSGRMIAALDRGQFGLPDRDYFLKKDERSVKLREAYQATVAKLLGMAGIAEAEERAAEVVAFETKLAEYSLDRVSRRSPEKLYHLMKVSEFKKISPKIPWGGYFRLRGIGTGEVNVMEPEYFKGLSELYEKTPVNVAKHYLVWRLVAWAAPALTKEFAEAHFGFYGKTLRGTPEQSPRWKRCVQQVDNQLGEALGQKFVEKAFAGESKERMLTLVADLEKAMEEDIESLEWMSEATRKRALEKLKAITNKIGYPDEWRDYSKLKIQRNDYAGNLRRAGEFETDRQMKKIGKAADPKEWFMSPPTVNAYYDPSNNNINFPAGILQPPFFEARLDDAVNYGAIGGVIGHELTHGFDDEGRKFDAQGNLKDWWTAEDAVKFEERAGCFVDQYWSYSPVAEAKVNGKLTLGENAADNGGLRIAYMALMNRIANQRLRPVDGFTAGQRFFLGWAQVWCENVREEDLRLQLQVDPHSPGSYRVNGVVSNMPEFGDAFACKAGDAMVREKACRIW
jgi:endothelin-converting enzyme/putative endopeptidase